MIELKKHGPRFLNADKIKVVQEAKERGVTVVSKEYGISDGTVYNWVEQFNLGMFKGREHMTSAKPPKKKKRLEADADIPPPVAEQAPKHVSPTRFLEKPAVPDDRMARLVAENAALRKALSAFVGRIE